MTAWLREGRWLGEASGCKRAACWVAGPACEVALDERGLLRLVRVRVRVRIRFRVRVRVRARVRARVRVRVRLRLRLRLRVRPTCMTTYESDEEHAPLPPRMRST